MEIRKEIKDICKSKFFTETANLSQGQLNKADDDICVFQTLMLLKGCKNFSQKEMLKFVEEYKESFNKQDFKIIKNSVDELHKAFAEKGKIKNLKKVSIPMVIAAFASSKDEVAKAELCEDLETFFEDYENQTEYKSYCQGGTASMENVSKRYNFFLDMINK